MNVISIIALILIFLGGIGGILLAIGQTKSSAKDKSDIVSILKSENTDLKANLDKIRSENDTLKINLEKRDKEIKDQNTTIISLHQKLNEKSDYIKNFMTGGSGYPFLDIRVFPKELGLDQHFLFQIDNRFDYPLCNIEIDIFDYDAIKNKSYVKQGFQNPFIKLADYDKALILKLINHEIPPHEHRDDRTQFQLKEGCYLANIHARNFTVTEKIAIVKQGDNYYFGFQIFNSKGDILQNSIDIKSTKISTLIIDRLHSIPTKMNLFLDQ